MAEPAYGLYPAANFRLTDGRCPDCPTIRQGLWYFEDELIAVPRPGVPVATFATGVSVADDLRQWKDTRDHDHPAEYPPLVWVAARDHMRGGRLGADATTVTFASGTLRFSLVPSDNER